MLVDPSLEKKWKVIIKNVPKPLKVIPQSVTEFRTLSDCPG